MVGTGHHAGTEGNTFMAINSDRKADMIISGGVNIYPQAVQKK